MPGCAAVDFTLNPTVQGGGNCYALGFPSRGHAHNICEEPPEKHLSAQGLGQLANTPGQL